MAVPGGLLTVLALAALLVGTPVLAGLVGAAAGSGTVTSGTFGAAPRTPSHQDDTPLLLAWGATAADAQYFEVRNTGTIGLTGATYALVTANGGRGAPSLSLTACVGARWTATGTCAGDELALGSWRVGVATTVVGPAPTAPGEDLHLRAVVTNRNLRGAEQVTVRVSVLVSSGPERQVRPPQVTSA